MPARKRLNPRFKRNGDGTLESNIREVMGINVGTCKIPIEKQQYILIPKRVGVGTTTYEQVLNPDYKSD